jgi:competence protein ComEC
LGIVAATVAPPLAVAFVLASAVVSAGAALRKELVPEDWRAMALLSPLFVAGGVGVALLHATAFDPLCELAALEPGEVVVVGHASSPPVPTGFGYRADLRVKHLWYEDKEVLRGGACRSTRATFPSASVTGWRVDGELTRPEVGEDGFDYGKYLGTNSFPTNSSYTSPTPSAAWLTSMLRSGWASTSRSYSLLVTRSRLTSDLRLCGVERERPA